MGKREVRQIKGTIWYLFHVSGDDQNSPPLLLPLLLLLLLLLPLPLPVAMLAGALRGIAWEDCMQIARRRGACAIMNNTVLLTLLREKWTTPLLLKVCKSTFA